MRRIPLYLSALAAALALAAPVAAHEPAGATTPPPADAATPPQAAAGDATQDDDDDSVFESWRKGRPITIQYMRPQDKRGINVFETTKDPGVEYDGFAIQFGAAFASQVQNLSHRTGASPNIVNGVDANQLADIGFGFNTSTANLYLNAQLAPGIRVALTSYLSSRHHPETWVKDGYLQIDQSPLDILPLKMLMEIATIRVGHFEINYGDAHFRRSDNGNALYNPFVGNYILDAFTTEIGGELYLKTGPFLAMGSVTGGELRGTVLTPGQRGPATIGKLGYDQQVTEDLRLRLTGSMYRTKRALNSTLYGGDRAGSRYYWVMENTQATEAGQFTSGLINPGFRNQVTAFQVNPFVKFHGVEVFGVLEQAEGKALNEADTRVWRQYAVDTVYRFLPGEPLFVGVRYNRARGELAGLTDDAGARRWQVGGGWFITPSLLTKLEYVDQRYFGYPELNVRHGGGFKGFIMEGVVGF